MTNQRDQGNSTTGEAAKPLFRAGLKFKLWTMLIAAIVFVGGTTGFYWYWFGKSLSMPLSLNVSDWGQFGDFLGGVLNPIVALLALAALLYTIYQNQTELTATREELRANYSREQYDRVINRYDQALQDLLHLKQDTYGTFAGVVGEFVQDFMSREERGDGDQGLQEAIGEASLDKDTWASTAEGCSALIVGLLVALEGYTKTLRTFTHGDWDESPYVAYFQLRYQNLTAYLYLVWGLNTDYEVRKLSFNRPQKELVLRAGMK